MTIDKVIKSLADNLDKRERFQNSNDSLGHKIWEQTNYANAFAMNKLYLDISHEEVDRYRNQKEVRQYELFEMELDTGIQSVFYKGKEMKIDDDYGNKI